MMEMFSLFLLFVYLISRDTYYYNIYLLKIFENRYPFTHILKVFFFFDIYINIDYYLTRKINVGKGIY